MALVVMAAVVPAGRAQGDPDAAPASYWSLQEAAGEVVEVAIVLDVSGSMDPLIQAAQMNLWTIVGELSLLEPPPVLRVALMTYASGRPEDGWVGLEKGGD